MYMYDWYKLLTHFCMWVFRVYNVYVSWYGIFINVSGSGIYDNRNNIVIHIGGSLKYVSRYSILIFVSGSRMYVSL